MTRENSTLSKGGGQMEFIVRECPNNGIFGGSFEKTITAYMGNTHKEVFGNLLDNRMMLWRHAVVVLLYPLNSGEKSTSPIKL